MQWITNIFLWILFILLKNISMEEENGINIAKYTVSRHRETPMPKNQWNTFVLIWITFPSRIHRCMQLKMEGIHTSYIMYFSWVYGDFSFTFALQVHESWLQVASQTNNIWLLSVFMCFLSWSIVWLSGQAELTTTNQALASGWGWEIHEHEGFYSIKHAYMRHIMYSMHLSMYVYSPWNHIISFVYTTHTHFLCKSSRLQHPSHIFLLVPGGLHSMNHHQ